MCVCVCPTMMVVITTTIMMKGANKGEGVVITRDRVAALDRHNLDPLQGRSVPYAVWFLVASSLDIYKCCLQVRILRQALHEVHPAVVVSLGSCLSYSLAFLSPVVN